MRILGVLTVLTVFGAGTALAQELPAEIVQRQSGVPSLSNGSSGSSGSGFRPSGMSGRPLRTDISRQGFSGVLSASRGSALMTESTTARIPLGSNVQRLRTQQIQRRQVAQRARRSPLPARNGIHEIAHELTTAFEPGEVPEFDNPARTQAWTNRLGQLSKRLGLDSAEVRIENQTAIVTGRVATEARRRVIEQMLYLEPGVRAVDNRLEVLPKPPVPQPRLPATGP